MKRFNKLQVITMGALILGLLFNPMSVEILDNYFKWAYTIISVLCAAWVAGFILYSVFRTEKTKIPVVKSKRSQAKD